MENTQSAAPKFSAEEIRATFERPDYVERYSNLNTGQQTAMDSALMMEVLASAAIRTTPHARDVLDIGCGAGNYTLKLLEYSAGLNCSLLDISRAMLDRAQERVRQSAEGLVRARHGDIREVELGQKQFDLAISGTALHHLRAEQEWEEVFKKIFDSLNPGGSLWIRILSVTNIRQFKNLCMSATANISNYKADRNFGNGRSALSNVKILLAPSSIRCTCYKKSDLSM